MTYSRETRACILGTTTNSEDQFVPLLGCVVVESISILIISRLQRVQYIWTLERQRCRAATTHCVTDASMLRRYRGETCPQPSCQVPQPPRQKSSKPEEIELSRGSVHRRPLIEGRVAAGRDSRPSGRMFFKLEFDKWRTTGQRHGEWKRGSVGLVEFRVAPNDDGCGWAWMVPVVLWFVNHDIDRRNQV